MANAIALQDIQLPAHLIGRTSNNEAFLAGLFVGVTFPTIGCKGTRFIFKAEGAETVLNTLELGVVLLSAKANLDKSYYASAYDPNQTEAKAPDCFSHDGIKPDAAATTKQCENCAGCAQNQFGSGKDAQGNPGKGKACADRKMLAIFAERTACGFSIPPASLKAFSHYVKETSRRGVDLSTAITIIGFDPNFSYPVLTFGFGGFLAEAQISKIEAMQASQAVADIIGGGQLVLPAPAQQEVKVIEAVVEVKQAVSDPFASVDAVVVEPEKLKVVKAKKEKVVEVKPVEGDDADLAALAAELGIDLG
jgi:hypothetical protein